MEFLDKGRTAVIDINRSESIDKETVKEIYESSDAGSRDTRNWRLLYDAGFLNASSLLEKSGYTKSLQDPIEYLNMLGKDSIFRFISTHPHMDHLAGLASLKEMVHFNNFWVVENSYKQDYAKLSESQKADWDLYEKFRGADGNKVDDVTVIAPKEGSTADFYTEDGIQILAPNNALIKEGEQNANIMSYVLLVKHQGQKVLLAGDAEEPTWKHLVENYEEELRNVTILKAAHHGRDSGFYEPAVELMSPLVTVVSVGKKPDTDAHNKYKKYCEHVWSTRHRGNIRFTIFDGGDIDPWTQYGG